MLTKCAYRALPSRTLALRYSVTCVCRFFVKAHVVPGLPLINWEFADARYACRKICLAICSLCIRQINIAVVICCCVIVSSPACSDAPLPDWRWEPGEQDKQTIDSDIRRVAAAKKYNWRWITAQHTQFFTVCQKLRPGTRNWWPKCSRALGSLKNYAARNDL